MDSQNCFTKFLIVAHLITLFILGAVDQSECASLRSRSRRASTIVFCLDKKCREVEEHPILTIENWNSECFPLVKEDQASVVRVEKYFESHHCQIKLFNATDCRGEHIRIDMKISSTDLHKLHFEDRASSFRLVCGIS